MNPLIEQFKRDAEEFEDFYFETGRYEKRLLGLKQHENFHIQSLLNLINKMICEEHRRKYIDNKLGSLDLTLNEMFNRGYNSCLYQSISQLQGFKQYLLEKLKK